MREIIQYNSVTKLPNMPDFMEGIISLRGKIIPVIELALRLGLSVKKDVDKKVLIVETAGQEVGILVDEVTEVIRLQAAAIESAPALAAGNECIRGIGKEMERLL